MLIVLVLELTNVTHIFHHQKAVTSSIPSSSETGAKNKSSAQASPPSSGQPNANKTSGSQNGNFSTAALVAPSGTFVSNHRPSLSGAGGVPSGEQSVCNTTPGANCTITFTNGGIIKTLAAQVVSSGGFTSWTWDVKQAGLTQGSWQITATATLNGQSQSTNDSLALEVQP